MMLTARTAYVIVATAALASAGTGCSSDAEGGPASAGAPSALAGAPSDPSGGAPNATAGATSSNPSGGAPNATAGASSGGGGSSSAGSNGTPATTEEVGRIDITLTPPIGDVAGAVSFVGKFYAAPYPAKVAWKVSETVGNCQLFVPLYPFCDPGCGTAVCVSDNNCVPYPKTVNVGTLSVQGLVSANQGPLSVEPLSETNLTYQPKASAGVMFPGVTPEVPVVISTASGAYGAFQVEAKGIQPFELADAGAPIRVAPNEPTHLAWKTQSGSTANINIELDISHHGGVKGQIVCDVEDTGTFDIPADLVSKLIGLGVSGFPTVIVTRTSRGSAATASGRVTLEIKSRVDHPVEIPGLVSCEGDESCPTGQTCQQDKQCK